MKYLIITLLLFTQPFTALAQDSTATIDEDYDSLRVGIDPYEEGINSDLEYNLTRMNEYVSYIQSAQTDEERKQRVLRAVTHAESTLLNSDDCNPAFIALTLAIAPFLGVILDDRTVLDGVQAPFTRCNTAKRTRDLYFQRIAGVSSEREMNIARQKFEILDQLMRLNRSCPTAEIVSCRGVETRRRMLQTQLNELN